MDKEDQEILVRYQTLESSFKSLKDQEKMVVEKIEELQRTKSSLTELGNVKEGQDIMIPIGSDNFVKGKIGKVDKILVGIGKGVAITKSREDTIRLLGNRINDLQKTFNEIIRRENEILSELEKIRPDIEKILSRK